MDTQDITLETMHGPPKVFQRGGFYLLAHTWTAVRAKIIMHVLNQAKSYQISREAVVTQSHDSFMHLGSLQGKNLHD